MIVEHDFVTTLDMKRAIIPIRRFLEEEGFSMVENLSPDKLAAGQFEFKRGVDKASRARSISELPQRIITQYDRGRITLVATITPSAKWGGHQTSFLPGSVKDNYKKMKLHSNLLMAILVGVEMALADGVDLQQAKMQWQAVERDIETAAKRRQRRNRIIWGIFGLFMASILALIIITIIRS